jgi:hypothetical protein
VTNVEREPNVNIGRCRVMVPVGMLVERDSEIGSDSFRA